MAIPLNWAIDTSLERRVSRSWWRLERRDPVLLPGADRRHLDLPERRSTSATFACLTQSVVKL